MFFCKVTFFQHGFSDSICNITFIGKLKDAVEKCGISKHAQQLKDYAVTNSFTSFALVFKRLSVETTDVTVSMLDKQLKGYTPNYET